MSIGSSDDSAKKRAGIYSGKAKANLFVEVYTKFVNAPSINCTDTVNSKIIKDITKWVQYKTREYQETCHVVAKAFFKFIRKNVAKITEFELEPNRFDISGFFNIPPNLEVVASHNGGLPKIADVKTGKVSTLTVRFDISSQNKITINYLAVR